MRQGEEVDRALEYVELPEVERGPSYRPLPSPGCVIVHGVNHDHGVVLVHESGHDHGGD